jgi:hypothetical protein
MHSAPFYGIVALWEMKSYTKVLALIGFGAFYMLFAWGFADAFDSMWPVHSFFGLLLNRMLGILEGAVPRGAQATYLASVWIISALAYLGAIFITALAPIPRVGITDAVIRARNFTTGGLWPEQPYRAIAFRALYFGIVGLWEVVGRRTIIRRACAKRRR